VNVQLHASAALPPGKDLLPIGKGTLHWVGPRACLDAAQKFVSRIQFSFMLVPNMAHSKKEMDLFKI